MKFTKTIEVKNIFNKISYKYDFLNNLLSFGLHRLWKRKLVNLLKPLNGEDWADLCCGTGDLAFLISERVSPMGSITGIDSAEDILNIAKKKSELKKNKFIKWEIKVNINKVKDRLPEKLIDQISSNPKAVITGYKMTDGRSIGITAKFQNGEQNWFFPEEIEKG